MNSRLWLASFAVVMTLASTHGFAADTKVQQTRSIGGDFRVATTENWQPSTAPARFRIALPVMSQPTQTAALPEVNRKDLDLR